MKIDLRTIPDAEVSGIDLMDVDITLPAPEAEPQRQYYFIKYNTEGVHLLLTFAGCNEWALGDAAAEQAAKDGSWANDFKHISYQESKSSNDTPRMEIDWIRFYKKPTYDYFGSGTPTRNKPMY